MEKFQLKGSSINWPDNRDNTAKYKVKLSDIRGTQRILFEYKCFKD